MKSDLILKFKQNLFSKVIWSSTFKDYDGERNFGSNGNLVKNTFVFKFVVLSSNSRLTHHFYLVLTFSYV